MKSDPMICTSVDNRYMWPWMVTIFSAANTCGEKFPKLILANINKMLSSENEKLAQEFAGVLNIDLSIIQLKIEEDFEFEHHFNVTIFSRILLLDLLTEDFLWLDSDLILMPGWMTIFEVSGERIDRDVVICGVLDSEFTRNKLANGGNTAMPKSQGQYLNSGVLLMSPINWKKIPERVDWISMAKNPKVYGINPNDQDILNYLCAGKSSVLPHRFNFIVGDRIHKNESILVQHFAGPPKPWKLDKRGKEFFMGSQGFNYFNKKEWITFYDDTFLYYPNYWQIESELFDLLQTKDKTIYNSAVDLRNKSLEKISTALKIKHFGTSLFLRKWR